MNEPEFIAPRNLANLAAALRCATPDSRLVAGGTDLMLRLLALGRPDLLIDLSGLRELSFIRQEGGLIRIGALTTFAELQRDALLAAHAGVLSRAAAHVGSVQIRNIATLGGNVANASPCADSTPALLVLDAEVGVLNRAGNVERRPLRDLLAEAGKTTLGPDEAIVDFSFVPLAEGQRSAFGKIGVRSSVAVAKLSAAMIVKLDAARRSIAEAKIAFGSIAPAAFVDEGVAAVLRDQPVNHDTVEAFATACSNMVSRSIPERSSLPYKWHAVRGLAHDLWSAIQGAHHEECAKEHRDQ
jgi:CO/xanthine dehydrogenase FAD-binding subunit